MNRTYETMLACLLCDFGEILRRAGAGTGQPEQLASAYFGDRLPGDVLAAICRRGGPARPGDPALVRILRAARRVAQPEGATRPTPSGAALESIFNHLSGRRGGATEVKSENFITRSTSIANPRSTERVVRGAEFAVVWFYTMEAADELMADMALLSEGCKLLSLDYLGGSGARGFGRVAFRDFAVEAMLGEIPVDPQALNDCFKDVESYAACDL